MPDYKMPPEALSLDNALHGLVCDASRLLATCRGLQKDAEFQTQLPFRRRNLVTGKVEDIDRTANQVLNDVYQHYARESLCLADDDFDEETEKRLTKLIVEMGRLHKSLESFWESWRQCNDQVDQLPGFISEKMDEVSGRKAWRERLRSELNEISTWHYWSGHDGLNPAVQVDMLLSTLELSGIPDWRDTLDTLGAAQKNLRAFRVPFPTEAERKAKNEEMFRKLRAYTTECRPPSDEEIELFQRFVPLFDAAKMDDWEKLSVALGLPADQSYRRPFELADLARQILWNEEAQRQEQRRLSGDALLMAAGTDDSGAKHSIDFHSVNWFGTEYTFSETQAACVKVLWDQWKNSTPTVGQAAILEGADSNGERLRDVFDKGSHPAWETMIKKVGKSSFRLESPEKK